MQRYDRTRTRKKMRARARFNVSRRIHVKKLNKRKAQTL